MSLIAQLKLTETDSSLGEDSTTLTGDFTNTSVTSVSDATYGNVAYFDGTPSYLTLPVASLPTAITSINARTFSLWVKPASIGSAETLYSVGSGAATGRRWRVNLNANGIMSLAFFNITALGSTTVLVADTWYHLAQTYNGTVAAIYVNGVLEDSGTKSVVTNTANDLVIGANTEGLAATPYTGNMVDFRIYDGALSAAELLVLYNDGPEAIAFSATMYTHVADLTWGTISGASTYSITQKEDAGTETIILEDTALLEFTAGNLTPGSSYEFNIYIDSNFLESQGSVTMSAPAIDSTSVQDLVTRFSNDLTALDDISSTSLDEIKSSLRDILTTGDVLISEFGESTFVSDSGTIPVPQIGLNVISPFDVLAGPGQQVTVTLPDASSSVITYDETLDEVISDASNYAVGEYFIVGNYKVRVTEL